MVFQCRPFMLRTINTITASACCAKFWEENRNRPSYLSAYNCSSHTTPHLKTHAAGEYTNTYGGCFDGEMGENTTVETERIDSGLQSCCLSFAFPERE